MPHVEIALKVGKGLNGKGKTLSLLTCHINSGWLAIIPSPRPAYGTPLPSLGEG